MPTGRPSGGWTSSGRCGPTPRGIAGSAPEPRPADGYFQDSTPDCTVETGGRCVAARGKALDILELVVLVRRRDERRAGDRPGAGRPGLSHPSGSLSAAPSWCPGENEWPVLLPAAPRGKAHPAPTPTARAHRARGGGPMSWTPASCSPTREPLADSRNTASSCTSW